jgi:NADP-dependent 3-hydroxy acid dehydrogenase YdfG
MTELHRDLPVHPKDSLGVTRPLAPEDIARMVLFVVEQPDHVAVPRLMVPPQGQAI